MPHSKGLRARTRDLFAKPFRQKGKIPLTSVLDSYKVGEYVDIVANGTIHKGMPHKFYHGKTGRIWNITPHAVGVVINKTVRNRVIPKKITVRVEHCRKSKCREEFLSRTKSNETAKTTAKDNKEDPPVCKRQPKQPKKGYILRTPKIKDSKNIKMELIKPSLVLTHGF